MKRILLCALSLGAISCKTVQTPGLSYADKIKETYDAAEKAFSDELYEEAAKNFEEVRSKYPYSKYAALSDFRLGDLYFVQEKWFEAADAYDFFLRFHPRHEKSSEASFKIAQSHYNAIPKDFFLIPKSYVKDQTPTQDALGALDRYLAQYPSGTEVEKAKKMRVKLRSQMALRDLSVAEFYLKRGKLKGAQARLEHVVKQYADTPEGEQAQARLESLQL